MLNQKVEFNKVRSTVSANLVGFLEAAVDNVYKPYMRFSIPNKILLKKIMLAVTDEREQRDKERKALEKRLFEEKKKLEKNFKEKNFLSSIFPTKIIESKGWLSRKKLMVPLEGDAKLRWDYNSFNDSNNSNEATKYTLKQLKNDSRSYIFDPGGEVLMDTVFIENFFISEDIAYFMQYGLHIGHSYKNSVYLTTWLVLGLKDKICIIDLTQTINNIKFGYFSVQSAVRSRAPIWFFNGNNESYGHMKYVASFCSESSLSGVGWVNGFFTNYGLVFGIIFELFLKILYHGYNVRLNRRKRSFLNLMQGIELSRVSMPSIILAIDAEFSQYILREGVQSKVLTVSIADTNVYLNNIAYPIPSNDDSKASVYFYLKLFAKSIVLEKLQSIKLFSLKMYKFRKVHLKKKKISNIQSKFMRLALQKPRNFIIKMFSNTKLLLVLLKAEHNAKKGVYTNFFTTSSWGFFEKQIF